jgi:hypothetical protein
MDERPFWVAVKLKRETWRISKRTPSLRQRGMIFRSSSSNDETSANAR